MTTPSRSEAEARTAYWQAYTDHRQRIHEVYAAIMAVDATRGAPGELAAAAALRLAEAARDAARVVADDALAAWERASDKGVERYDVVMDGESYEVAIGSDGLRADVYHRARRVCRIFALGATSEPATVRAMAEEMAREDARERAAT